MYAADLLGPGGFRKSVALKVIGADHAGALGREARLGGLLRHPNLVEIYDLGEGTWDPGPPEGLSGATAWYCAMERVAGPHLGGRRYDAATVVDVALQVCAGLSWAHQQIGLVHCDLKPENLLRSGELVKVADLGVALARGSGASLGGTPGFMAPEQRRGGPVDQRTDVFALGRVIEALLARPARGGLAEVLARATATDPADRYATLVDLAAALRALRLDPEPAEAVEAPPGVATASTFAYSAAPAPGNLPPATDRFVGRDPVLEELVQQLRTSSLVTIKGPGGVGKTRLATEIGRSWGDGEAWFCDASTCRDAAGLVEAAAATLGLAGGSDPLALRALVGRVLADRAPMLLILDNLEQVDEAAAVVTAWRAEAPEARLLVTSRAPLFVRGEVIHELGPLDPDAAVALVRDRAGRRGDAIADTEALRRLVDRLDRIPLALELVAPLVGSLGPEPILAHVDLHLRATAGPATADRPGRHASLDAALDWSWALLRPHERVALSQLAVFRGGFTLAAAEEVLDLGPEAPWVLDVVEALLDRSLLRVRIGGTVEPRFDHYETVRVWALSRLDAPERVRQRHVAWFARAGAPERRDALHGPRGFEEMRALVADRENLEAAIDAAIEAGDTRGATAVALALSEVCGHHAPAALGVAALDRILALTLPPLDRARVEIRRAFLLQRVGDYGAARQVAERVVALAAGTGDVHLHLQARLNRLAIERNFQGAAALVPEGEQLVADAVAAGDRRTWATALGNLGIALRESGDDERAIDAYREAIAAHERLGDRGGAAVVLGNLANVLADAGRIPEAMALWGKAIDAHREAGNHHFLAIGLGNVANALAEQGRHAEARRCVDEAFDAARRAGLRRIQGVLCHTLGLSQAVQGHPDEADQTLAEGERLAAQAQDRLFEGLCAIARARIAGDRGRREELEAHLSRGRELVAGRHTVAAQHVAMAEAIGAALAGDRDGAARALDRACDDPTRSDLVALEVNLLRGRLLADRGALDAAVAAATSRGLFEPGSPLHREWRLAVAAAGDGEPPVV